MSRSFLQNGSVDLLFDSEGGHYESSYIKVEKGKFEGQLVIGDSFVNPVKDFTITKDDVIVLQLVLPPCTAENCKAHPLPRSQGLWGVILVCGVSRSHMQTYTAQSHHSGW